MKLLIVSHSSRRAGAERVVRLMAEGLPQADLQVFVTTPEAGPLTRSLVNGGTRTEIAPVRWWTKPTSRTFDHFANRLVERVDRVADIASTNQVDVVLTNSMVIAEGALAAAALGLPHAWYVHEMLGSGAHLKPLVALGQLHRYMDALADVVFAASTAVSHDLCSTGELHAGKVRVVNYGLDFDWTGPAVSSEFAGNRSAPVVLVPARLTERKGVFTMLEAFVTVRQHVPAAQLILAGEGPRAMRKRVARFIADRRLGGVDVPGFVSDMPSQMARADIVALPSVADPFPVAVLEAMALGKPVVGTYSGGMADQIIDGQTGWLVPISDPEALAERIVRLLNDISMRQRMGEAARERLRTEFPMRRMLAQLSDGLCDIRLRYGGPTSTRNAAARELLGMSRSRPLVDVEEHAYRTAEAALAATRRAAQLAGTNAAKTNSTTG